MCADCDFESSLLSVTAHVVARVYEVKRITTQDEFKRLEESDEDVADDLQGAHGLAEEEPCRGAETESDDDLSGETHDAPPPSSECTCSKLTSSWNLRGVA